MAGDVELRPKSGLGEGLLAIYFIGLAVLMHCFQDETVELGKTMTVKHLVALIIIFSGFVCFLIKPDISGGIAAAKGSLVIGVTLLATTLASFVGWLVNRTDSAIIKRGISYNFWYMNGLSAALAAAVFLYLFGKEKGFAFYLTGIIIANGILLAGVIAENGAAVFFGQLWVLIKTFAGETSLLMMHAEFHEMAFCLGAFITYMLVFPRKKWWFWLLFSLATALFIVSFKRIAIIAVVLSVLAGWFLRLAGRRKEGMVGSIVNVAMVLLMAVLVLYILLIKENIFEVLEELGIGTSGRNAIYETVEQYYSFSPKFAGHGMGFVLYTLNNMKYSTVSALHNDFLHNYIELGFLGYIVWLAALIPLRVKYFGRTGTRAEICAFCVIMYFVISSTTDNTMIYQNVLSSVALITMLESFEDRVAAERKKYFGDS